MSFPLTGIRVLDFTRLIPGAFATLMLAELGAEVIKIEDPRGGDPMRSLPPLIDGRGIYDILLNRGKKSVVLDLRDAANRPVLDRLIATSDVVIESFRPGAAKRLGIGGAEVRAAHPRVIHCAITGYGQTGPYAEVPGHDLNYVALSGFLAADRPSLGQLTTNNEQLTTYELPRMFIADIGGGAFSAVAGILAALIQRGRTGEGQTIDVSMHEAALYWMMLPAARALVDGGEAATDDLPTFGRHATYNVYRAKDGLLLALGALEAKFWRRFCETAGRDDLIDRQLTSETDQHALIAEVATMFASKTRAEWLALFHGHDVCLTPVHSPADALRDPHVVARGVVESRDGLRAIRPPFIHSSPVLAPAPALGQHTEEVLGAWRT